MTYESTRLGQFSFTELLPSIIQTGGQVASAVLTKPSVPSVPVAPAQPSVAQSFGVSQQTLIIGGAVLAAVLLVVLLKQ